MEIWTILKVFPGKGKKYLPQSNNNTLVIVVVNFEEGCKLACFKRLPTGES